MLISIFRVFFLYLLVILVMRIMGKREIGQLQPYELAITLIISELVTLPMENNSIPLASGIIPVVTITLAQLLLSYLTTKSQWIQDFVSGKYTIIIENGKMIQEPALSPDGKKAAFVFENNLYFQEISNGKVTQITFDGEAGKIINGVTDWVYEEEFGFVRAFDWSAESKKIAVR